MAVSLSSISGIKHHCIADQSIEKEQIRAQKRNRSEHSLAAHRRGLEVFA